MKKFLKVFFLGLIVLVFTGCNDGVITKSTLIKARIFCDSRLGTHQLNQLDDGSFGATCVNGEFTRLHEIKIDSETISDEIMIWANKF